MSSDVISVAGVGKRYNVRPPGARAITLAESALSMLRRKTAPSDEFWALREIDLRFAAGETVGIIGHNGAGKSTLLKLLSRVTAPTTGTIELRGRVCSLLEVGTGFHPELTGRENIALQGALLGMASREVRSRFDAIVDFAGVERFLDTPVKRYSSGMFLRLALAVALHLDAEILLLDEVLTVGDSSFRSRSLRSLREQAHSGRTILMVSHAPSTIRANASRVVVLERGRVSFDGGVDAGLQHYAGLGPPADALQHFRRADVSSDVEAAFAEASVARAEFAPAEPKEIRWSLHVGQRPPADLFVSCAVFSDDGSRVLHGDSRAVADAQPSTLREGAIIFRSPWLRPGRYSVSLFACGWGGIYDSIEHQLAFSVNEVSPYDAGPDALLRSSQTLADYSVLATAGVR